MKKYKTEIQIFIAISILIVATFFTKCNATDPAIETIANERGVEIEIGKSYLFSYNWNPENPFKKTKIDTITILNIKEGYVEYRYNHGIIDSDKIIRIEGLMKEIK